MTEVGEVIGKSLTVGKQLLETGKTTSHRMPSGIDYPGVGQNQVNQADMSEIVRHLVDEKRRAVAQNPG
jgi:hypothetical protein